MRATESRREVELIARWFTSLIGKYASVLTLVDLLRSHKAS